MAVLLDGNFVLLVILLFINLVLCLKAIPDYLPVVNVIFSLITLIISITVFLPDNNIPAQPYLTLIVALMAVIQLLVSVLNTKVNM